MSDSREAPSSLYRIELLREDNWLPWKRRITGILRDRNLLKYVDGTAKKPAVSNPAKDGEAYGVISVLLLSATAAAFFRSRVSYSVAWCIVRGFNTHLIVFRLYFQARNGLW
jgi:gag-polypeptide of LTR copia-type